MIAALARNNRVSAGCIGRRLAAALVVLAVAGGAWRLCRPFLVAALGKSSVGCPGRAPLLAAALRQRGFVLPSDSQLFDSEYPAEYQDLRSHSLPRPGWIVWEEWTGYKTRDAAGRWVSTSTLSLADADLNACGSMTWGGDEEDMDLREPLAAPPGDYDGDGTWEALLRLGSRFESGSSHRVGYAVVRTGDTANQACAYVVVDVDVWSRPRPRLSPLWQDTDGDGISELVFASENYRWVTPNIFRLDPPQTYAVFAWTGPTGVLVPRQLPVEGGVYFHAFTADDRTSVPRDEDIGAVLRQLRPPVEYVTWLRQHAVTVRTIDPAASPPPPPPAPPRGRSVDPAATQPTTQSTTTTASASSGDFADLAPLKEKLAGVRVVFLGEPSHGDGAALRAKARVAEFLHAEAGFDVLAWETGLFDAWTTDKLLRAGRPAAQAFAAGLPDLWSATREVRPLLEYIADSYRTARPLEVAGFSIAYQATCEGLLDELVAFCDAADPALLSVEDRAGLAELDTRLRRRHQWPRPETPREPPELAALVRVLERLKGDDRLTRAHSAAETEFLLRSVENLVFFARQRSGPLSRGGMDDRPQGEQEARNLLYLIRERYPDRKIIVWAHTCHLIRNCAEIEELGRPTGMGDAIPAGELVYRALGEEVYSIAFLSYGGRAGIWWESPRDVPRAAEGALEELWHRAGATAAFVDLRGLPPGHWLRAPLTARPLAFEPMRACWGECFDGFFFNDQTAPSTHIEQAGDGR